MYNHTLHCGRKHFYRYWLQAFSSDKILKCHIKDCVKTNGFTINNKLNFIDSLQFLSSWLESLVKNSKKDDFEYLSQEFDKEKIDLVKQKGLYPCEYITDFEKFKE